MTREPDPTGFDAIVASWRAEGNVPEWPDDLRLDDDRTGVDPDARPETGAGDGTEEPGTDRSRGDAEPPRSPQPDRPGHGRSGTDPPDSAPRADRAGAHLPGADRPDAGPPRADLPGADDPNAGPPRADRLGADRADAGPPRADLPGADDLDTARDPGRPGGRGDTDHRDTDRRGATPRSGTDPHGEDTAGRDPTSRERGHLARPAADPLADEHFVPPEPPPLPRMGPPILIGLTLITLGLVLVTFPGWVGVPQVYGLPLGLVAIAAGLGWLVLRLWPDPDDVPPPLYLDDPDDPDGGAVL